MTIHLETRELPGGVACQAAVDGAPLSWGEAIELLRDEAPDLRQAIAEQIRAAPWPALYWEAAPVAAGRTDARFRWVLLDAPALAGKALDRRAFAAHLADGEGRPEVRGFANLGGDAWLLAPTQACQPAETYLHLAAFCRGAPAAQVDALWRAAGQAIADRLEPAPRWLSTAGLGVGWLHLRLDTRPKYIRHQPFKAPPS